MSTPTQAAGTTEIIARAVITRGDALLVVRHVAKSWSFLPGGHVEPGERVEDALIREIDEEIGLASRVAGFVGVAEHGYIEDAVAHHELNFVFDVKIDDPDPRSHEDHLEFRWVPLGELPECDLRPGAVKAALISGSQGSTPFWRPWLP